MLDINAKQIAAIDYTRLDNATLLSFVNNVQDHGRADATMQAKLGDIWTSFDQSTTAFDVAYNPSHKDLLTDILKILDDARDKASSAWHVAILAALKSPNQTKQWIAQQLVQLYKDYHLDISEEYMKQSTNIDQMIQSIEANAEIMAALPGMGLDDYFNDLKAKNNAFIAKMEERTASTVGKSKGAVAAARADVEQKVRTLFRMVNVVNSYEGGGVLDAFIEIINAEVEHYRQILARKGVSTGSTSGGSGSNGGGSGQPTDGGQPSGGETPDPGTGGDTPDPGTGGGGDTPVTPDPGTGGGGDTPGPDDPTNSED